MRELAQRPGPRIGSPPPTRAPAARAARRPSPGRAAGGCPAAAERRGCEPPVVEAHGKRAGKRQSSRRLSFCAGRACAARRAAARTAAVDDWSKRAAAAGAQATAGLNRAQLWQNWKDVEACLRRRAGRISPPACHSRRAHPSRPRALVHACALNCKPPRAMGAPRVGLVGLHGVTQRHERLDWVGVEGGPGATAGAYQTHQRLPVPARRLPRMSPSRAWGA